MNKYQRALDIIKNKDNATPSLVQELDEIQSMKILQDLVNMTLEWKNDE